MVSETVEKIKIRYIEESYNSYGNDGDHFGNSVYYNGNDVVNSDMANSLANASDHLPVYVDLDFLGIVKYEEELHLPDNFELFQNYSNPFNPGTNISIQIPKLSRVELKIFNIRGELVKTIVNDIYQPGIKISKKMVLVK